MNDNDLKGKIACELIIEAIEQKGKRPTLLNFDELIDVVTGVVKKINYIPCCMGEAEQLTPFKCPNCGNDWDAKMNLIQQVDDLIVELQKLKESVS